MKADTNRYYIGLMSGTSLDGIDAALVCMEATTPRLIATHAEAMPDELYQRLLALCHAPSVSFAELALAEAAFCRLQARAVQTLLETTGMPPTQIQAIGSHGQTIEHAPGGHDGGPAYTLQLDNPSLLAELTGCAVVGDFRRRDLAAGGQAAPLAPAFHQAVFASEEHHQLILNLGGFANLTWLPPRASERKPLGFDTGPANVLLDAWYQRHQGGRFDHDGRWAASGYVDTTLLERLLAEPFFQQAPPRSTGREMFHLPWLESHLRGAETSADVQATLAELTAASVAQGIIQLGLDDTDPVVLIPCGGGAHNPDLLARLAGYVPNIALRDSADWGWPADWMEAGAFAWLAHQRLHGLPGNLPSVTGARGPRILGGIYAP
ncbi:anhydro-N-acetylmuramic acid kinase [Halomonas sp. Bachu 37]|uniref:anhydro-N-acetylmuramic acid kinase n=1 Tax=Halomonas kashgarensis TaxID=3084920 RepID=UPI003216C779